MTAGMIDEIFASVQGEGPWSGQRHIFVRFVGCDLRCSYCDTPEAVKVPAGGGQQRPCQAQVVEQAKQAITSADVLLLQLEIPLETVGYALHMAHGAEVKVVLNPAPGQRLNVELLRQIDVLTPNETEAQLITGLPVGNLAEAEQAANHLLSSGVGAVVITLRCKGRFDHHFKWTPLYPWSKCPGG